MQRTYSEKYINPDDGDARANRAVSCFRFDSTRFALCYVLFVLIFYGVVHGSGYSTAESLAVTSWAHAAVTFVLLHWAKGSPDTHAQGVFDGLTVWEQMDGGRSWSPTKHVFLFVPTLVLLAQLNARNFDRGALVLNLPIYALFCVLPKLPAMHGVRLFGVNRTVGIDDGVEIPPSPKKKRA